MALTWGQSLGLSLPPDDGDTENFGFSDTGGDWQKCLYPTVAVSDDFQNKKVLLWDQNTVIVGYCHRNRSHCNCNWKLLKYKQGQDHKSNADILSLRGPASPNMCVRVRIGSSQQAKIWLSAVLMQHFNWFFNSLQYEFKTSQFPGGHSLCQPSWGAGNCLLPGPRLLTHVIIPVAAVCCLEVQSRSALSLAKGTMKRPFLKSCLTSDRWN